MSNGAQILEAPTRIEGRVAQLLNARELVINIGSSGGVKPGMTFAVLADKPVEIRDPQTGDILDVVDREKVRVRATEIRPKIAICRTYRVTRVPPGPLYGAFTLAGHLATLANPPREIPETLEADRHALPPPLDPDDSYVKINDRVVMVKEND
jgi:hypothetical protein